MSIMQNENLQRFDKFALKAMVTDEGFIYDTPVISRTGVFVYRKADGTEYGELRLPKEVFNADSLATLKGKPISIDHKGGAVTASNARSLTIGSILSEGKQDENNLLADIVIHSPDDLGDRRELSLGYNCDLEWESGEYEGVKYDAIQRNIRYNHLSAVRKGRAGVARLNLDGNEVDFTTEEHSKMTVKVKLDNGIEYDAAPEVAAELQKLRADASDAAEKLKEVPTLEAKIDALQAKVDGFEDELKTAHEDGKQEAIKRLALEGLAAKFSVDHADKSDREIKEEIIKTQRKDSDLSEKSDAYIDATLDILVDFKKDKAISKQREAVNTVKKDRQDSAVDAYANYMNFLVTKEAK